MAVSLTDEQQSVVNHDFGAAVVHAVAGAGKTTAMVARIARLVKNHTFAADRILATSFSRDTVQNLKNALEAFHGCHEVSCRTLHSVGMKVIQLAERLELIPRNANPRGEIELISKALIRKAVKEARQQKLDWAGELEQFDEDDFEGFIGRCKGNLEYANLRLAPLPKAVKQKAKQALAPQDLPWYLELFGIYERIRLDEGLLTFDDMLLSAWELLESFAEVRSQVRAMFDCVLVDEFQDVNLVQSELLNLLVLAHQNYMVIGDDDQTIYEWRGASPRFILDFAARYKAQKYIISDNFRCTASQIALANRVIAFNTQREPKTLSLTKGFAGSTRLHHEATALQQAQVMTTEIISARDNGTLLQDMAILVRSYAQTPDIETALEKEQIPYRIIGATPFFERLEIKTLLAYLRLALIEQRLNTKQTLTLEQIEILGSSLKLVMNRPSRYISSEQTEVITRQVLQNNASLVLTLGTSAMSYGQGRHLMQFAKLLEWLVQNLEKPILDLLSELERRLDYKKYLLHSSAFEEIGEGKVRSIEAFIAYTSRYPNALELIRGIARFEKRYQQQQDNEQQDTLSILTIHRSKGLEWDVVFVPDLNEGSMPFGQPSQLERIEEERRLLYVAITRTKRDLHLLAVKEHSISRFLEQANPQKTILETQAMRQTLETNPLSWSSQQALGFIQGKQELLLERYFTHWWHEPLEKVSAVALQAQRFIRKAKQKNFLESLQLNHVEHEFWAQFDPLDEDDVLDVFDDLAPAIPIPSMTKDTKTKGSRVRHKKFGIGHILETRGANASLEVVVRFENGETKRLLHRFANLEMVN